MSTADSILSALQSHNLKSAGRDKYRSNSPLREDSDSGAFSVTIDPAYGGGGKFYDFITDESGNFITLAKALGLATDTAPKVVPQTSTKRAYTSLADYAQHQGVSVDVLQQAGWSEGRFYCPRHRGERPALIFKTATGERARFTDGLEPRYMSPKDYQRCWYGLRRAVSIAAATGRSLTICNGEASTIVAQHHGVPAVAITGGGEHGIPSDLLDELLAAYQGTILITLDSDDTGRKGAAKMRETLRDAGYGVRALDLNGPKGFDLANFAKLHGEGAATALLDLSDLAEVADAGPLRQENERLRELVATQQQIITSQRQELEDVKIRQRWQTDLIQNPDISAGEKITIMATYHELAYQESKHRPSAAPRPINFTTIGNRTGQSPDTVSRCVKRYDGVAWARHETKTIDAATGMPRTNIQLAPLPALETPQAIRPEKLVKRGGAQVRRCNDCGSEKLLLKKTVICGDCGCAQGDSTLQPINTPEQQVAAQDIDETPGIESTTETLQVAESAPSVPQLAALNYEYCIDPSSVPQVAAQQPAPMPQKPPGRVASPSLPNEDYLGYLRDTKQFALLEQLTVRSGQAVTS